MYSVLGTGDSAETKTNSGPRGAGLTVARKTTNKPRNRRTPRYCGISASDKNQAGQGVQGGVVGDWRGGEPSAGWAGGLP